MQKLNFKISIHASAERVWHTITNESSYRQWAEEFHPNSYFEGEWKTSSPIKFLAPEADGSLSGMYGKILEAKPYEFISILNIGEISGGREMPAKSANSQEESILENYTLNEKYGTTELVVDINSPLEYAEAFGEMWPKALEKLKQLAEHLN